MKNVKPACRQAGLKCKILIGDFNQSIGYKFIHVFIFGILQLFFI